MLRDRRIFPETTSKKSYGTQSPQSGLVPHESYSVETRPGVVVGEGSVAIKTTSMGDKVGGINRLECQLLAYPTTPMKTVLIDSFLSS